MACASSLLSEDQFLCSICLDVLTDPISTPCGHNYCKSCITHYWDSADVCQCPLCQETFYSRPKFSVNKVLSEMADQFRKSKKLSQPSSTNQEPADEVSCDFCTETKLKALKSCLVCLTSYCETHLEPHLRLAGLKRHKLIDPVKNLEDCMCKKHDRPLELFCKTDLRCVCQFCTESDHKLHQTVSLKEGYEGKKAELGKKDADREKAAGVQVFTALISCIERSQAELNDAIEKKQKSTEKRAEGFVKALQQEITRLEKRSSELKQFSQTQDHLHLLQNFKSINRPPLTKDWTKVRVQQSSYMGTVRTAVRQLEKTLSKEVEKLRDVELRRIQKYAVDVTLDPDTAHGDLWLSEDEKRVCHPLPVFGKKPLPKNKERFVRWPSILGKQRFSSGRFYYEVQVKGRTAWTVGVARECIRRAGYGQSPGLGSWTISLRNGNEYEADGVLLPVKEKLLKVGVFVDYEEPLVSFYDVETRVHLYSFTGFTLTDKLCPYFCTDRKDFAPLIISPVIHTD